MGLLKKSRLSCHDYQIEFPELPVKRTPSAGADSDRETGSLAGRPVRGRAAVGLAKQGESGVMVTLKRQAGSEYKCTTGTIALEEVAIKAKPMPDEFINSEGNFVTDAFLDYLQPLVGELPDYARLAFNKV